MTWWQNLFYGFNTTKDEPDPDPANGRRASPEFIKYLEAELFYYDPDRGWWQRVWCTEHPDPDYHYPQMKQVFEIYVFDDNKWTYKIVNPALLGGLGGGGAGSNFLIWENEVGEKE